MSGRRRTIGRLALGPGLAAVLAACASVPKPAVLAEVDQVRRGAAAEEARRHAPGAFAHAEKLRREADAAFEAEDPSGAQILGERAIAAYAHAHTLARTARAEASDSEVAKSLEAAQAELSTLEADQARVAAEIDALDLRIKVARDAQPIVPSGRADADREKARLAAARALALQARMLCGAARLLLTPAGQAPASPAAAAPAAAAPGSPAAAAPAAAAPGSPAAAAPAAAAAAPAAAAPAAAHPAGGAAQGPPDLRAQLTDATAALDKLDADLAGSGPAPIDQASRVRAGCLTALTAARRAASR